MLPHDAAVQDLSDLKCAVFTKESKRNLLEVASNSRCKCHNSHDYAIEVHIHFKVLPADVNLGIMCEVLIKICLSS